MIFVKNYSLDKSKFFVLIAVFFILSSFLWFKASGQEDSGVIVSSEEISNPLEEQSNNSLDNLIEYFATDLMPEDLLVNNTSDSFEEYMALNEEFEDIEIGELKEYVLFEDGVKQIETEVEENRDISITKEEEVLDTDNYWKKDIKIYSNEHFDRSLRVYSDIVENEGNEIEIYWVNEGIEITQDPSFDLILYDTNFNGLADRVSFLVPHLSEQNFEIKIFYGVVNSAGLTINVINSPPLLILNNQSLSFNFTVGYSTQYVSCSMDVSRNGNLVYSNSDLEGNAFNFNIFSLVNGNYLWNFSCADSYNSSINDQKNGSFEIALNYTALFSFESSFNSIPAGQNVDFYVNISTLDNRPISYTLFYGEGSPLGPLTTTGLNAVFSHNYSSPNNYVATLVLIDGNSSQTLTKNLNVFAQNNASSNNGKVDVILLSPSDNSDLFTDHINFSYYVKSNASISNCTFNLYYFNNSGLGVLVYDEINRTIVRNSTDLISLSQFDEGDYSWEVECYDSEKKYDGSSRDFTFYSLSNFSSQFTFTSLNDTYERSDDVESLTDRIDSFLELVDTYGPDQKEAIEILGLTDELLAYKRKLNQFKQDLKHNTNFMKEDDKEKRKKEIFIELDEMIENVPKSLVVVKSEEYVKNSMDSNLEEIASDYAKAENIVLSNRDIRNLAAYNKDLQNKLKVSFKIKHVLIEYEHKKSEISLLEKSLDFDFNNEKVLEIIPGKLEGSFSQIVFVNINEVIKEKSIFSINPNDLVDGKVIYYLDSFVDLEQLKELDTVVFSENFEKSSGFFTGFAVLTGADGVSSFAIYFSWFIFVVLLFFGGLFVSRNINFGKYSNSSDVKVILRIVSESKKLLNSNDICIAKANYERVKSIYDSMHPNGKPLVYKELQKLLLQIDRSEVSSLIEEYLECVRHGRKEDSFRIYNQIQVIYKRLPSKYKEKIRSKLLPYVYSF